MHFIFPPFLEENSRVWTVEGYPNHGPLEGPTVTIAKDHGGTVIHVEIKSGQHLYSVRWDDGQLSKHYEGKLLCIGTFKDLNSLKSALSTELDEDATVQVYLGPSNGFRQAKFVLKRGRTTCLADRRLWEDCVEPVLLDLGIEIVETREKRSPKNRRVAQI